MVTAQNLVNPLMVAASYWPAKCYRGILLGCPWLSVLRKAQFVCLLSGGERQLFLSCLLRPSGYLLVVEWIRGILKIVDPKAVTMRLPDRSPVKWLREFASLSSLSMHSV